MPSQKNINQLKTLTEKLEKASSVVLLDYKGLTHEQLADLRKKLIESGSSLMVTKNTLLKRAMKQWNNETTGQLTKDSFAGPTATLFVADDPLPPLKTLSQFSAGLDLPKIKIGILEGEVAEKEKILRLANLPSKEVLTAQVIGGLKAPTQRLIFALNWNLQKLMLVLKKMGEKESN